MSTFLVAADIIVLYATISEEGKSKWRKISCIMLKGLVL